MQTQTDILLDFFFSTLRSFVALFWGIFLIFHRRNSPQIIALSSIFIIIGLLYLRNSFLRLPAIDPVDAYTPLSYLVLIFIAPFTLFYIWFALNEKKKWTYFLIHYIPFGFVALFWLVLKLSKEVQIPHSHSIIDVLGFANEHPLHVFFYLTLIIIFLIQVLSYFFIALNKIQTILNVYQKKKLDPRPIKKLMAITYLFLLYPLIGVLFLSFNNELYIEVIHNLIVSILITTIAVLNLKLVLPMSSNINSIFGNKLNINPKCSLKANSIPSEMTKMGMTCQNINENEQLHTQLDNPAKEWEKQNHLSCSIEMLMESREIFRLPQLTLDDLVTELNSNRSYVSANINKYCGCNFKQLLIRYRINAAKELLLHSELDIQTIAEQAGFNSRMSFYRAFKKNVCNNLSPIEWQKQELKK
ncbi:MAG: AraC family transcriptional regulator [Paludibacter sp.]|nr:AraC family transcriptional regulator [Paludibacter sp.]